jgi:hypothetical protein
VVHQAGEEGEFPLLPRRLFKGREHGGSVVTGSIGPGMVRQRFVSAEQVGDAAHIAEVLHGPARVEAPRDLEDRPLPHAEHQQVRLGGGQDARHHLVRPVVVVRDPAQRRFHAPGDHRHPFERLPATLHVDRRGPIGAQPDRPSGAVGVGVPPLPVCRVVVDHRVHVAGGDTVEQAGASQLAPRIGGAPVGLRKDRHPVAVALQPAAQDRRGERRVVDVGVPGDEDDVGRLPAKRLDFSPGRRQEGCRRSGWGASHAPTSTPGSE